MFGNQRFASENARLNRMLQRQGILICAHRGTSTGTITENTLPAMRAAVRSGASMVEIDVIASVDGEHFLFHDGLEPYRFGVAQNITSMTTAQIRGLVYIERTSTARAQRVEALGSALAFFRGDDVLLNIDRSWWYWDTLLPYLDGFEMTDQLVLKSGVDDESLERLRRHPVKYPFIPMVRTPAEIERVLQEPEINLVGAELLAPVPEHPFTEPSFTAALHAQGLICLVNALNLDSGTPLFAGFDDEISVLGDPSQGWGRLVDLGADIIQTDWTSLLSHYLTARAGGAPLHES